MSMKLFYELLEVAKRSSVSTRLNTESAIITAAARIKYLEKKVKGLTHKGAGSIKGMDHTFSLDKPFFVHDPEGDRFTFFATEKERAAYAKDAISEYLYDCWSEEVVNVCGGVMTHQTIAVNVEQKPDTLDEDGVADDGSYWDHDWDYKCDYELLLVKGS